MSLSADLLSQFVKATKDEPAKQTERTVYGTIVHDGKLYVKIDGSELLTPVTTTADVVTGDRVTVMIKDHTAIVTGNMSSPSARNATVTDVAKAVEKTNSKITELGAVVADKVSTETLEAEKARIDGLTADNIEIREKLTATEADIGDLTAKNLEVEEKLTAAEADIEKLDADKITADFLVGKYAELEKLQALEGEFNNLDSNYANFTSTTTDKLAANEASINSLTAVVIDSETGNFKFANIDFSNIGQAAVKKLFTDSGIIKDLVASDVGITGELVGVTINGDLINANTLKADRLVVKGSDGLYYKLNVNSLGESTVESMSSEDQAKLQNGLHGSNIIAKTITAEKVRVDDLVAFGATIGGFNITASAIYSGAKASVDNTTQGIYMGTDGQFAVGDSTNYLKYYKDANGNYKLAITARSVLMSSSGSVEDAVNGANQKIDNLDIGGRNLVLNSGEEISFAYKIAIFDLSEYGTQNAKNRQITMSFDAYTDEPGTGIDFYMRYVNDSGNGVAVGRSYANDLTDTYTRYSATIDVADVNLTQFAILTGPNAGAQNWSETATIYVKNVKVELGNKATDWTPAPEDVNDAIIDATDDVREAMVEQDASLIEQCKDLIDEAGASYPTIAEYQETKQSFESQFEKTDEAISSNFTKTTEQIVQVDGVLQTFKTSLSKHVEFSADNAITIGGSSGIILTVDNDNGIVFSKIATRTGVKPENLPVKSSSIKYQLHTSNATAPTGEWATTIPKIPVDYHLWIRNSITYGNPDDTEADVTVVTDSVAFGSWDGTDFYTGNIVVRLHERAQFGNFAFVPRSDGSLSFLKVGG